MEHSHSARHGVRWSRWVTAMVLGAAANASHADGSALHPSEGSITDRYSSEYALAHSLNQADSLRLVGNYYLFDPAKHGMSPLLSNFLGGFRASTGIIGLTRPVSLLDRHDEGLNLPYVGLGYSHLWFTGQLSLNADFGLASQPGLSGGGHLRSLFGGPQSFDDTAGDPRWAPVMAVNVRYSF